MTLALYDRVQQTGTANTTVSFTLSGSVAGYQSFVAVGNGNTTYYGSFDTSGNWEVGLGTYSTTGPTLTRTTILSSSNGGLAVTFSSTVNVFITYPSEKSVNQDANGNVGIGTSSPTARLDITEAVTSTIGNSLGLNIQNNNSRNVGELLQIGMGNVSPNKPMTVIGTIVTSSSFYGYGEIFFATRNVTTDTAPTERMRIDSSGNVVIGATTSTTNGILEVASSNKTQTSGTGQLQLYSTDSMAANLGGQLVFGASYSGTSNTTMAGISGRKENGTAGDISGYMAFWTNKGSVGAVEAMRIDSSGNVGIGTSSPATYGKLAVNGSIDSFGSSGSFSIFRRDTNAYAVGMYSASGGMIWDLNSFGSAMTLDSSGNLLIGTTTSPSGSSRLAVGAGLWSPHTTYFQLTPKYTSGTGDYYFYDTNDGFFAYPDNYQKLGNPSYRWTTVYATTALINTSDANQKQQIRNLNDAEKAVAQSIKGLIKAFKFNDSVAEKGDGARIHVGVIAQEVQSAFEAQGLDSSKYAMFCSDTWYEVDGKAKPADGDFYTKETPNAVEVTRLGIRYDQLLAFVISTL